MPNPNTDDNYTYKKYRRHINIALVLSFILCVLKIVFCRFSPEVLSGMEDRESSIIAGFIAILSVTLGYFYLNYKKRFKTSLLLLIPSFYIFAGLASLQAQFIIFYQGRNFKLIDKDLAYLDNVLGFNWISYFDWVIEHPFISWMLTHAYDSIWYQPIILTVLFVWTQRVSDYSRFQIALPLSFLLVCLMAMVLPALGAYQFHNMTPSRHPGVALAFTDGMTAPMLWLRQAELPPVLPRFPDLRVITFPSWHAAAAVIFILSAWPLMEVRWLFLVLNVLMLAATPVQGSHYLSDIIIGASIGGITLAVATWALSSAPLIWWRFGVRCKKNFIIPLTTDSFR